ncbi:uncharacterized protein LOC106383417 [Brassica napus]|uniref:uncharacterized protein LOC106383417 n=1 Tax=Brassica napus TaxID=3708 RepID=UPI0006AA84B2|nr:uncharacterized protein LOC106383417 [Brassica napus]
MNWQETSIIGLAMFSFSQKLKLLKKEILDINREHFSNLEERLKEAHSVLVSFQNQILVDPSPLLAAGEREANKKWVTLALAEERFLEQRSRVNWSANGNMNTAVFHRMVASRRATNQIHYLMDLGGNRLSELVDIKSHCVSYYEEFFGAEMPALSSASLDQISSSDCRRCEKEIFSLPRNKMPGPDGYTGEFYRKTWDVIGPYLTRAVLEFFSSGKLLKQWNCTFISLIPKRVGADKLVDFRPISLCNVVYKVISKILARRLQDITPTMVSSTQSAFIKDRLLVENVLLATEMVQESLQTITSTLDNFNDMSGLRMNRDKTELFLAGLNPEETEAMNIFGFQKGSLPIKYLGLPLMHKKLWKSEYSPLTDRIKDKFNSWTVTCLSFAGRLPLILAVIYNIVNFWFTAFCLPKGCLKEIESLCSRFLWSGDIQKRSVAKVLWQSSCLPKSEGGLGLRNFEVWNKALNLKLVWLLFASTTSLWVAWMREHKLKRRNFWSLEAKETDSWIWKTLLSLRPLASQMLSCRVGDGRRISFWYDNWSIHGPLIRFIGLNGPLLMGIQDQSTVAEALLVRDWQAPSRTQNQNVSLVRATLRDWPHQAVPSEPDIFMWGPSDSCSDIFSTKKTWEFLRPRAETKEWSQVVLFKNMVPKHAFNFWMANLNRLPLNERLHQWGLMDSGLCTLCSTDQESRDHLFLTAGSQQTFGTTLNRNLAPQGFELHHGMT